MKLSRDESHRERMFLDGLWTCSILPCAQKIDVWTKQKRREERRSSEEREDIRNKNEK